LDQHVDQERNAWQGSSTSDPVELAPVPLAKFQPPIAALLTHLHQPAHRAILEAHVDSWEGRLLAFERQPSLLPSQRSSAALNMPVAMEVLWPLLLGDAPRPGFAEAAGGIGVISHPDGGRGSRMILVEGFNPTEVMQMYRRWWADP